MFMVCWCGSPSVHRAALIHPSVQYSHQGQCVSANQKLYWLAIATPGLLPIVDHMRCKDSHIMSVILTFTLDHVLK